MSLCVVDGGHCCCEPPYAPCDAVEALRKDAERYRWLTRHAECHLETPHVITLREQSIGFRNAGLDALIDGCIQRGPQDERK